MNDILSNLINNTLSDFNIPFCVITNIATYLIIKWLSDNPFNIKFTTWKKRITFIVLSIFIGAIYYFSGTDFRIIINSIILAPVSWSWIFKPICNKFNIDYSKN